jgi:hypothetical protein
VAMCGSCGEAVIVGHPASAGRATGPVRIVHSPRDSGEFRDGDVLVAKATAPAWTPLFARAAAIVTDSGTLAALLPRRPRVRHPCRSRHRQRHPAPALRAAGDRRRLRRNRHSHDEHITDQDKVQLVVSPRG